MTIVQTDIQTDVQDEFDLDIQIDEIDETDLPARKYAPRADSFSGACSCTWCCATFWCASVPADACSRACN